MGSGFECRSARRVGEEFGVVAGAPLPRRLTRSRSNRRVKWTVRWLVDVGSVSRVDHRDSRVLGSGGKPIVIRGQAVNIRPEHARGRKVDSVQ